jgi:phosphoglycolate phosphatase
MIKLVIFDLDGTLLYTINDLANSVNYALEKCGFPTHSVDDYKTKIGNGFYRLIERALPEGNRSEDTIMQVKEIFAAY